MSTEDTAADTSRRAFLTAGAVAAAGAGALAAPNVVRAQDAIV
jgi:hypothetical protein